jgi:hypothetical protein
MEANGPCFKRKNIGVKNEIGAGLYFKTLSRRDGGAPGKGIDKKYAALSGTLALRPGPANNMRH